MSTNNKLNLRRGRYMKDIKIYEKYKNIRQMLYFTCVQADNH